MMKVALVHDDLVQWGGAERMLLGLSEIFPDAPIYTSVYDSSNSLLKKHFTSKKIVTSFIQKIPGWRNFYKALLPLYPIAFEQFDFSDFDLVISHTTRFAKSIITQPQTRHICYCHTPPRFLWNFSGEKVSTFLQPILSKLRIYDQISANRVDQFVAGSENARGRIKKIYHKNSKVVYPFVEQQAFSSITPFGGNYFLIIARLNPYKKVDLAIEACKKIGVNLKIVGTGPQFTALRQKANSKIEFLGAVSDQTLKNVLAGCKALIVTAEEDFGLTPLEAQMLGKPVIALKKGGVLETVIEEKTGIFFEEQTVESLSEAIERFEKMDFDIFDCIENAKRFSFQQFKLHFMNNVVK